MDATWYFYRSGLFNLMGSRKFTTFARGVDTARTASEVIFLTPRPVLRRSTLGKTRYWAAVPPVLNCAWKNQIGLRVTLVLNVLQIAREKQRKLSARS